MFWHWKHRMLKLEPKERYRKKADTFQALFLCARPVKDPLTGMFISFEINGTRLILFFSHFFWDERRVQEKILKATQFFIKENSKMQKDK